MVEPLVIHLILGTAALADHEFVSRILQGDSEIDYLLISGERNVVIDGFPAEREGLGLLFERRDRPELLSVLIFDHPILRTVRAGIIGVYDMQAGTLRKAVAAEGLELPIVAWHRPAHNRLATVADIQDGKSGRITRPGSLVDLHIAKLAVSLAVGHMAVWQSRALASEMDSG